jgi:uncharacterized membrane protein
VVTLPDYPIFMGSSFVLISEAADSLGRFFHRNLRLILRSVALAVLALSVLAPVLRTSGQVTSSQLIYQLEGTICHQESDRCFRIGNEPAALCSRCLGAYFGFLLSSFLFSVRFRPGKRACFTIGLVALAGLVDTILHLTGLYDTPNLYRLISGIAMGAGLGMLVFRFIPEAEAAVPR